MTICQTTVKSGTTNNRANNTLLSLENSDYNEQKMFATARILSKSDEFKQRGVAVVKKSCVNKWLEFVDNFLADTENIWYNGAGIEATLQCMEKLSEGLSVEEAYSTIDIQNAEAPCIYHGMELSGWHNYFITGIVGFYHERGQEFCDYRNNYVSSQKTSKRKDI